MGIIIEKDELSQDKSDISKARMLTSLADYMQDKREMMTAPWEARPSYYGARAVFFWIDALIYTYVLMNITAGFVGDSYVRGIICLLLMYLIPLFVRIYLDKTFRKKADALFEEKEAKYLAIRNKYVAEAFAERGYVRTSCELSDCIDEVWTSTQGRITKMIQGEFIACTMKEYMNFEYVVVGHLSDYDLEDKKAKRETKHAGISRMDKYNGKAVEQITLGVREFDMLYDVYTVDEVKARTYLSSIIVDRLVKNAESITKIFERGYEVRDDNVSFKMLVKKLLIRGASFRSLDIKDFIKNAEEYVAGIYELDSETEKYQFLVKGDM